MEDVPELIDHFLELAATAQGRKQAKLSAKAMDRLMNHPWPGNVRELKHALEGALVFCDGETILPEDLQLDTPPADTPDIGSDLSLEASERLAIVRALKECNGVKKDAADKLGISRRAIHYKIRKYGLDNS